MTAKKFIPETAKLFNDIQPHNINETHSKTHARPARGRKSHASLSRTHHSYDCLHSIGFERWWNVKDIPEFTEPKIVTCKTYDCLTRQDRLTENDVKEMLYLEETGYKRIDLEVGAWE